MPKLKPATLQARREMILDAAELCFARAGFHRTTMQDICKEAGVSPGGLYIYFESKEALIAGIAERDRDQLADGLKEVGKAPDLVAALARLGEHYAVAQPHHKRVLFAEIGVESTRNPAVAEIFQACDNFCLEAFTSLLERAQVEGRIAASADPARLAQAIAIIGDGLFWRRAVDPRFDAAAVLPLITQLVSLLLAPTSHPEPESQS